MNHILVHPLIITMSYYRMTMKRIWIELILCYTLVVESSILIIHVNVVRTVMVVLERVEMRVLLLLMIWAEPTAVDERNWRIE